MMSLILTSNPSPQSLQSASQVPRAHTSPPCKTSRITLFLAGLDLIKYVNMDLPDSKKEKVTDNNGKVRSSFGFLWFVFVWPAVFFFPFPNPSFVAITKYLYRFSLICWLFDDLLDDLDTMVCMSLKWKNLSLQDSQSTMSSSPRSPTHLTGHQPSKWYHLQLRTIALFALPFLSFIGIFGTLFIGGRNGTFEHITNLVRQKTPSAVFPNAKYLLLKDYTGIRALDRQLTVLVTFFAPVVDSKNAALYLNSIYGLGQFGAAWTLLVMESLRSGNKGRAVSL